MRRIAILISATVLLASCSAFGDLTTGAMTTTDHAVGAATPPPPAR